MNGCEVGERRGWAAVEHGEKQSHRRRRSGGERGVETGNPEVWQTRWELGRTRSLTRKQRGEKAEAAFLARRRLWDFGWQNPGARVLGTTCLWITGRG